MEGQLKKFNDKYHSTLEYGGIDYTNIGKNEKEYITKRLLKMFQSDKLPELLSAYKDFLKTNKLGSIYSAILTDICFGIPTHKTLQKKVGKSFGYLFST